MSRLPRAPVPAAIIFPLVLACGSGTEFLALPPLDNAKGLVLLADSSTGPIAHIFALPDAEIRREFELEEGSELVALLYEEAPGLLGLPLGLQKSASPDEGETLPDAERIFGAREGDSEFVPISADESPLLRRFRLLQLDPEECAIRGGCSGPPLGRCVLPCPDRSPVAGPLPPVEALEPVMLPCAPGFVESATVSVDQIRSCVPLLPQRGVRCAVDESPLLGSTRCERIGFACPSGRFKATLPGGTALFYVDPSAPAGGDGSIARPFVRIDRALAGAPNGTVLALARARFEEEIEPVVDVTLVGACVLETVLAPPPEALRALNRVVTSASSRVQLKNLRIEDGPAGAVVVFQGSELDLEDVLIQTSGEAWAALVADFGGVLRGRRVAVRQSLGPGITIGPSSRAELFDLSVEDSAQIGIHASQGAVLEIDGAVFRGSRMGALSATGAKLELSRASIEGGPEFAIHVQGSTLTGSDLFVYGTGNALSPLQVGAIELFASGSSISLDRSVIEVLGTTAIRASNVSLALHDVLIRAASPSPDRSLDYGILVTGGGINAERLSIVGVGGSAIELINLSSQSRLSDLMVFGTGSRSADAAALTVSEGGSVRLERAFIEASNSNALRVFGPVTVLDANDVIVRDTTLDPVTNTGSALLVLDSAQVELRRAVLAGNGEFGVNLRSLSTLSLEDAEISDNDRGGIAVADSRAVVSRARIERNGGSAAFGSTGSQLDLFDCELVESAARPCNNAECAGNGIVSGRDGAVSAVRFRIRGNASYGVVVEFGGQVDLTDGEVADNLIGARVDDPSIDLERLLRGVLFLDNGTNLVVTAP